MTCAIMSVIGTRLEFVLISFLFYCSASITNEQFLDGMWQPFTGGRQKFYVYSAYLDYRNRDQPIIRVIALITGKDPETVFCHLTLRDSCTVTMKALLQVIKEKKSYVYSAAFILCPLHIMNPYDAVGGTLSIIPDLYYENKTTNPNNKLPVLDIEPQGNYKGKFHVCVPPLPPGYKTSTDRLLEWIELNRLLGVSKFYIYHMSADNNVNCVLEQYSSKGVVEIRDWYLDMNAKTILQTATLQDCLYRSMSSAEFLLVINVDEYILPQFHNLKEFMRALRANDQTAMKSSAFVFKKVIFYTFWPDDRDPPVPLLTSKKTLRTEVPMQKLSRYIVRPYEAEELGLHSVETFLHYWRYSYEIPIEIGLLHIYTDACEDNSPMHENSCNSLSYVTDKTAHQWGRVLFKRVNKMKKRWQSKNSKCTEYLLTTAPTDGEKD